MSNKCKEADSPIAALKDESARRRWEMFHRAIAHAKRSNETELDEQDGAQAEPVTSPPKLSVVR